MSAADDTQDASRDGQAVARRALARRNLITACLVGLVSLASLIAFLHKIGAFG